MWVNLDFILRAQRARTGFKKGSDMVRFVFSISPSGQSMEDELEEV